MEKEPRCGLRMMSWLRTWFSELPSKVRRLGWRKLEDWKLRKQNDDSKLCSPKSSWILTSKKTNILLRLLYFVSVARVHLLWEPFTTSQVMSRVQVCQFSVSFDERTFSCYCFTVNCRLNNWDQRKGTEFRKKIQPHWSELVYVNDMSVLIPPRKKSGYVLIPTSPVPWSRVSHIQRESVISGATVSFVVFPLPLSKY